MTDSVLDLLPPAFRYRRVEIPPEQNAFEPLARAIAGLVGEASDYPSQWPPDADDRACGCTRSEEEIREVLFDAKNEDALAQAQAAVAKGKLQLPDVSGLGFEALDLLDSNRLRLLFRICKLRCQLFLVESDPESAVDEVCRMLAVCKLITNAGGLVTQGLVNFAFYGVALWTCFELVDGIEKPAQASRLLRALIACDAPSVGFQTNILIDMAWTLARRANDLPQSAPVDELIDGIVNTNCASTLLSKEESPSAASLDQLARRRKRLRDALVSLIDGHPQPYDRQDCIRLCAEHIRMTMERCRRLDALRRKWGPRFANVVLALDSLRHRQERIWPCGEFPIPFQFPVDDEEFEATLCNSDTRMFCPLTPKNLQKCRRNLWKRPNPLGQLLAQMDSTSTFSNLARLFDASLVVTQSVTAIRAFELQHGRLPRRLDEIISAGVLTALPIDPYSGRPLRYDADCGLVWSVGEREDCAMESRSDPPWRRRMVWQMKSAQGRAPSRWQAWWRRLPPPYRGWDDGSDTCSVGDKASPAATTESDAKSDST